MPAYDPSKNGWTTLFLTSGSGVTIPEQLTKKWWDKKKQTIAKTHATGIGELLDPLQGLLNACDLQRFPGSPTALEGNVKQMKAFMTSSQLKALRNQFKEIRDTAKTEAVHYRKSALTKKTAEVLDEIESVADCLFVCTNPASLADMYKKAEENFAAVQLDKAKKGAGQTVKAAKLVVNKLEATKKIINDYLELYKTAPETPVKHGKGMSLPKAAWGNELRDLCRDITQPLGNLSKAFKAGSALQNFDNDAAEILFDKMSKISNTKGHTDFSDKLNATQCEGLTKKVEDWADEFVDICGEVELGVEL